ncbi:hypothetical protein BGP84_26090 [Pseudomonas putida]|uniref:Uncharacterized protein n=1 Tax=Pseudomonas putida TaxID=303 RepID=A0A2S3WYP6_PSEPU|nr:hypothetical protein BGP84_26090 [Pseudomonas putida]POG09303.1 hypothetical protein BGP85_20150 [Pseudomonas putida]
MSGNVITDAFFVGSPAGLEVTLKPYDNQRQQDTYALYFTDTPPADGALPVPVESGAVPPDRKLLIPKSTIETLGDGIYYLAYILIDPATHVSRISHLVKITVNLGALPANLKPPVVPLAADGGLIDLDDVRLGVVTQIEYDNHRSDDFAEVTWGNSDPFKVQIGTSGMPHSIRIPYATLRAAYDFSLGSPQTATVSYRILRHDVSYGLESTDVNVDLSTAGPDPDPIQPGPINPELRAPVIKGAVTPEDNKLREEDAGQPVQLTWDLHPDLKDGQRMRFSWGGIVVPDPAAPDTPLEVIIDTAVDPITVNLEWDVVEKAGNSSKTPVHCIFLKETGEDNQQHSISQLVDVDAIIIEPDPAVFERSVSGEGKILGCESLWVDPKNPDGEPAFLVTVHGLSEYLPAGGKINMKWTPLLGRTGENPISGAGLEIALDFTKEQAEEGFQWEIKPYEKHILPIFSTDISQPEGRGRVEYSFELDGKPLKSKPATIRVALGEPTGGSCPLPVKP